MKHGPSRSGYRPDRIIAGVALAGTLVGGAVVATRTGSGSSGPPPTGSVAVTSAQPATTLDPSIPAEAGKPIPGTVSIEDMTAASDFVVVADITGFEVATKGDMTEAFILYVERPGGLLRGGSNLGEFSFEQTVIRRQAGTGAAEYLLTARSQAPLMKTDEQSATLLFLKQNTEGRLAVLSQYMLIGDGIGFMSGTPVDLEGVSVDQFLERIATTGAVVDRTSPSPTLSDGLTSR